ncbi:MAG: SRPBCC family protein [Candidatus Nanopelagicales bacterium]
MARYVARVRTPMSVVDAFALVSDMRTFAEWDPGVRAVDQVVGDGPGAGAEYDVRVSAVPRDLVLRYVTERYEVGSSPTRTWEVLLVARGALFTSVDLITVTAAPGGSLVVYDADLRLTGPLRVADLGLRVAFSWIGGRAEAGLRAALRGTSVPG